jgi:hypothetical protein
VTRLRGSLFFFLGLAFALASGWVAFPRALYRPAEQPLRFSHLVHSGEAVGLKCEDCHPLLADGRFAGVPSIAKCAECHSQVVGDSPEEKKLVEEYVTRHRELPWLACARQPDNVRFPHAIHVRLGGIRCEECHGPQGSSDAPRRYEQNRLSGYSRDIWGHSIARIGNASWEGKKMTDCAGCHSRRGVAESCLTCHK